MLHIFFSRIFSSLNYFSFCSFFLFQFFHFAFFPLSFLLALVVSRINASNKTYAETLRSVANRDEIAGSTAGKKPTEDSGTIKIDTRNEMITREKERKVRANNFIIHGVEEKGEDLQDIKKSDSQIIKLFFEKFG